jgi:DNA-binding CsgD family transcriptional regulator
MFVGRLDVKKARVRRAHRRQPRENPVQPTGRPADDTRRARERPRHLTTAELEHAALIAVFEHLPSGVFVLDEHSRVILHNRAAAAILAAADGLSLSTAGKLTASGEEPDATLQQLLHEASSVVASGARQTRPLRIGRRPYALLVAPLSPRHAARVTPRPAAAVFVTDLGKEHAPLEVVRARFHLTPAESRVAELLARGERAGSIAARLRLALPTVRTHIRRLLDKTGARGQSDLVRVLLTAPGEMGR